MAHPLEIELRERIRRDCYSTAYPWRAEYWADYLRTGALSFSRDGRMSFYIHIPFCKSLCKFCEYTRCLVPDEATQLLYLQIVHDDIRKFLFSHPDITLEGFDIGGGTPTALSPENFAYLMRIFKEVTERVNLSDDFEPSIEASLSSITTEKIKRIAEAGFHRISIGVQSSAFSNIDRIVRSMETIRECGDFKINLDFMYGFKDISTNTIENADRIIVERLRPEQVTLYELRTNQNSLMKSDAPIYRIAGYESWHRVLSGLGYNGRFGQNTFSLDSHDFGVSSYLQHRMLEGGDYKGFGISAQSMCGGNVEYNLGKNSHDILSLISNDTSFDATGHYDLPTAEKFAKFICVSGYSGAFNWRIVKKHFYTDFFARFGTLLDFLIGEEYIEIDSENILLTPKGFAAYGPLLSLFYRSRTK